MRGKGPSNLRQGKNRLSRQNVFGPKRQKGEKWTAATPVQLQAVSKFVGQDKRQGGKRGPHLLSTVAENIMNTQNLESPLIDNEHFTSTKGTGNIQSDVNRTTTSHHALLKTGRKLGSAVAVQIHDHSNKNPFLKSSQRGEKGKSAPGKRILKLEWSSVGTSNEARIGNIQADKGIADLLKNSKFRNSISQVPNPNIGTEKTCINLDRSNLKVCTQPQARISSQNISIEESKHVKSSIKTSNDTTTQRNVKVARQPDAKNYSKFTETFANALKQSNVQTNAVTSGIDDRVSMYEMETKVDHFLEGINCLEKQEAFAEKLDSTREVEVRIQLYFAYSCRIFPNF